MRHIAVYTSVATQQDARRIAEALVERRLAACAQISEIESFYRWEGAVKNEPEWRILVKTTEAQYVGVERAIRELHPYEMPAIYAVACEQVFAPYAGWVEEASSGAQYPENDP